MESQPATTPVTPGTETTPAAPGTPVDSQPVTPGTETTPAAPGTPGTEATPVTTQPVSVLSTLQVVTASGEFSTVTAHSTSIVASCPEGGCVPEGQQTETSPSVPTNGPEVEASSSVLSIPVSSVATSTIASSSETSVPPAQVSTFEGSGSALKKPYYGLAVAALVYFM